MANKYTFNKDYFERIDSKDKAYFLGFLYADGCNSISTTQHHCTIILNLQEKDKDILDIFNKYINSNKPLTYRPKWGNHSVQYALVIHSKK